MRFYNVNAPDIPVPRIMRRVDTHPQVEDHMFVLKRRYNDYSEAEDFQLIDLWHNVKYAHNRCRAEVYSFYVGCSDHNRIQLVVQKEIRALLEVRHVTIHTFFTSFNQFGSVIFDLPFPNAPS